MTVFDVAIVGGGPAGAAMALVLARAGRRVILADAAPLGSFRVGEGLPPSVRSLLRELGLLEHFLADGHRISYGNVSLWGSAQAQSSDFIAQWHGHGFQLDRQRFDGMLRTAARAAGAQVHEEARLSRIPASPGDGMRLSLRQGQTQREIECRWLVDAGGRAAGTARGLGARRQISDKLIAFHALFRSASATDRDGRTLIEACPGGWWYSVLLPSAHRLVAYLTDLDLVDRRQLLSGAGFQAAMQHAPYLAGLCREHAYQLSRAPQGANAASGRMSEFAGADWLAVGDAALSFDPLSSQGILNALYTGIKGAQALLGALEGDSTAVPNYATQLGRIHAAYMQNRASYYAAETRWPEQAFWQRRHGAE